MIYSVFTLRHDAVRTEKRKDVQTDTAKIYRKRVTRLRRVILGADMQVDKIVRLLIFSEIINDLGCR